MSKKLLIIVLIKFQNFSLEKNLKCYDPKDTKKKSTVILVHYHTNLIILNFQIFKNKFLT